jgi:multidrug resistance efflux pump
MADTPKENEAKYNRYKVALTTLAPEKTFGGVTPESFDESVQNSDLPRQKIRQLQEQIKQEEANLDAADAVTMKKCEMIKKGVVADPEFGDDSALYEALGYVRKSERKSGLTRKKKGSKNEPNS